MWDSDFVCRLYAARLPYGVCGSFPKPSIPFRVVSQLFQQHLGICSSLDAQHLGRLLGGELR
jgi:hypothetical protein